MRERLIFCFFFAIVACLHQVVTEIGVEKTNPDVVANLDVATRLRVHDRQSFSFLLKLARLFEILYQDQKPYTLFVPTNNIVGNYTEKVNRYAEIRRFAEYHIYEGFYEDYNFRDGQRVTSYDNTNKAFLNRRYSRTKKRMRIWVQGVEVDTTTPRHKNSTIIHLLSEHTLQIPTEDLFEYLERSGGYSIVMGVLKKYKLYFRFPRGVTFLAPLDKAFSKLPEKYKAELFKDDVKIRSFMRNHIITRPMCRGRLFHTVGWTKVINNMGNTLHLYQDIFNTDASYVNGAAVVTSQALTNGWTYSLSDVLLPEIKRKILEELRYRECHTFLEHLITTGHMQRLSSLLQISTVFAPTDEAFDKLSNETLTRLTTDREFLQKVISYHVVIGKYLYENLANKEVVLKTVAKDSDGVDLFLHADEKSKRIGRSQITKEDLFALNGIIHVIDHVLIPPEESTLDIINKAKNLRIFKKYNKLMNEAFKEALEKRDKGYTFFIPSNRAVKKYFQTLNTDTEAAAVEKLNQVIWRHVVAIPSLISPQLTEASTLNLKTMFRSNDKGEYDTIKIFIPAKKKKKAHVKIPQFNSQVVILNMRTVNGVIHVVDQVFSDISKTGQKETVAKSKAGSKSGWKKLLQRWAKNKPTPPPTTTATITTTTNFTKEKSNTTRQ